MNHLPEYLKNDYLFWARNLNEFDKTKHGNFVTTEEVLRSHYFIVDYFHSLGEKLHYGIKDFYLIGSAVGRQFTSYGNTKKWNSHYEIAATLFFGLDKNHAFNDGNKRTALLILLYYLIQNGYIIEGRQNQFEELAVLTAANELSKYSFYKNYCNEDDPEVKTIAHFLKKNTRKADGKFYSITYQELETKLNHFGFFFDVDSNYVTIYKYKQVLLTKKKIPVIKIGFPGWKKQINLKALKSVLKECELTQKNRFDIQSLWNGTESMYRLINDYEGPLRRLKDK